MRTRPSLKLITGLFARLTPVAVYFVVVTTASAEICVFPQTYEACTGADCLTDLAESSDSGVGANASVNLDERRALVRASGGAGIREANGTVGIRIEAEITTDVDISTRASFSGVIQGGALPTSFGRVTVWAGIRNLTTGSVDEDVVFDQQQDSADVTVLPQFPLQALTRDFSSTLEADEEYVIYFRVRTQSRGATSNSDFRSGIRGVYFEALTLMPTTTLPDADGDGLFDVWEDEGVRDCDDNIVLNLPALGATSDHKDIFIEYDWTAGNAPVANSIAAVKAAFAAAPNDAGGVENPDGSDGIRLWIDTGDAATGDDLGGGEQIDPDDIPNGSTVPKFAGDFDGNGTSDFYDVKEEYFDPSRRFAFHYLINSGSGTTEQGAGPGSCGDGIDNDGDGLVDGDDIANCHRNSQAERPGNDIFLSVPGAGILMHELGHNLNLQHGGDVGINCKPNYVSVMNYNMQNGIPQDTFLGQDTNADGVADNRIVDYAPPRFPGGGRGAALPDIDESSLDENVVLDSTDPENQTVFIDATGATQTTSVDQPLDWAGDGSPPDAAGVMANVNSGPSSGCSTSPAGEDTFQWHDDWSEIEMNFRLSADFADAANNPTEEPEPTQEELEELLEAIYTTDLAMTKTIDPNPVAAGQPVIIALSVENLGPNHAQEAAVRDAVPDGIEVTAMPEGCELSPGGEVTCLLGRLREGESREIRIAARVRRDVSCDSDNQFTFISNTASVENLAGDDPNGLNDNSTDRLQVLCLNFEYPAKVICGRQGDPDVLRLMRGLYGTTVNIHNPNDADTYFFKKLALAFPPAAQRPGRIIPLAIDRLAYDESLKTDCDEIKRSHFPNGFPDGYIEGHVIVQSPLSLDVQSVFTAAPLDREGKPMGVASIDVEYVPERDVAEEEPGADLAVIPFHPEPPVDEQFGIQLPEGVPESLYCGANGPAGGPARTVDAIVRNIGSGGAAASTLRIEFEGGGAAEVSISQLDPGADVDVSVEIPRGCYGVGACMFTLAADADAEVAETNETNNDAESLCLSPAG